MAWWITSQTIFKWVRLNYASAHHHPPPPTTTHHPPPPTTTHHHSPAPPTTSQNISTTTDYHSPLFTTTHQQPKNIHHHPPPDKIYPPLPTTSQKMDHPTKAKIYSNITSLWHCSNSFFFFEMQYSFPWRRFCVIKFWPVCFSNSKFLLHFTIFNIF